MAYQTIFKVNLRAKHYSTTYVDAFAGTGTRAIDSPQQVLELQQDEAAYKKGSVRVALELPQKFDRYLFVERKRAFVVELNRLIETEFPQLADSCDVRRAEANAFLSEWCRSRDWSIERAVVFLDPYGMSVEWPTIEALGKTRGVDLWVLLPVGVGVNRVLVKGGLPTPVWGKRLNRFFGTTDWVRAFYKKVSQQDLFGGQFSSIEKTADFTTISSFFIDRLKTVFPYVADTPRVLVNSKNNPLFMLHFASHNKTGLKIANHILTH